MSILFITGNPEKLREVQTLLPDVEGRDLDLCEIQELDARSIIRAKLAEAQRLHRASLMVEDTSLSLDGMNGLPGPFIKWFLKAVGLEGVYHLTELFGTRATARTLIGFAGENGHIAFFEGVVSGTIVSPRGSDGFGWDPLFQPDGQQKTFAEMVPAEKHRFSMRRLAIEQLRKHLEQEVM
jgi:XTP/dITP diphosphohydrolase